MRFSRGISGPSGCAASRSPGASPCCGDLLGIIGTFRRDRLLVRLQINGSLPDDRFLEAAFSRGLNDIFLSLDTLEDGLFSRLSGTGESALPGRVRENIAVAARIAGRQRAGAFLLTVLQPENSGEVDELVAFAREHRCLIGFYGREEGPRGEGNDIRAEERRPALTEEGRTKLLQAFTRLRSLKLRSGSPVFNSLRHIEDYLRFYGTGGRDMRWNCSAGDSYLAVLPDGRGCICNATPPVPGLDHRSMPAFYARPGRTELFQRRRAACAGCLCTRQLEHLVHDWADIGRKTLQYARMTLLRP